MGWQKRIVPDKVENKNLGWQHDSYLEREVNKFIEEHSREEEKDKIRNYQVIEFLIKCYVLAKVNTCQLSHSQSAGTLFMDLPFAG